MQKQKEEIVQNIISALACEMEHIVMKDLAAAMVIFNLSLLRPENCSGDYINIALSILRDALSVAQYQLYIMPNYDIIIIIYGNDIALIVQNAIFQLRYLFIDDPLANNGDLQNSTFYSLLWLPNDTQQTIKLLNQRYNIQLNNTHYGLQECEALEKIIEYTEGALDCLKIENFIIMNDIFLTSTMQACIFDASLNLEAIQRHLAQIIDFANNDLLFSFARQALDIKLITYLLEKIYNIKDKYIMLALSLDTISSPDFLLLTKSLEVEIKRGIVICINTTDIFHNILKYQAIFQLLKEEGYSVCIDFPHFMDFAEINWNKVGCDVIKYDIQLLMKRSSSKDFFENQFSLLPYNPNNIIATNCYSQEHFSFLSEKGIGLYSLQFES